MEKYEKTKRIQWQNELYADPGQWQRETVISVSSRLRIILRYANILEFYGLIRGSQPETALQILEPGCGIGLFSALLTAFGDVSSFDYSREAIERTVKMSRKDKTITFFIADGSRPKEIGAIQGRKFDFIIMREFHPFSRDITGNPDPADVLRDYLTLLNHSGIIIIEQALKIKDWWFDQRILRLTRLSKEYHARLFYTHALDILLFFPFILRNNLLCAITHGLLSGGILFLSLILKLRISKTIVIQS